MSLSLGIGMPLGILSLVCLGIAFWKRWINHPEVEKASNDVSSRSKAGTKERTQGADRYEMSARVAPQDFEMVEHWPEELGSNPVHEAAEAF